MANKIGCGAVVDEWTWHQHCCSKSFFSHALYGHGHSHAEKKKIRNTRQKRAATCVKRKKNKEFKLSKRLYNASAVIRSSVAKWKKMRRVDRWKQCSQWTCQRGNIRKVGACFPSLFLSLSRTYAKFFGCKQKNTFCAVFKMLSNRLD